MQDLTDSVGDGGKNLPADTALVQAILVKTRRAAAPGRAEAPYLASYDGQYGASTLAALRAFQDDWVFVSPQGNASAPNSQATAGRVLPGDATWQQLVQRVPADFANLRALPGGRIVYVQATAQELQSKLLALSALTFTSVFRTKVRTLIERMHADHGIAIGVCPQGDRRNFQAQYALLTNGAGVTNAGPGESNHNYGMGTDMGFAGLRWLHADGKVDVNETPWLHHLEAYKAAQANIFWAALRAVGTSGAVGLFRGPVSDKPHLQNWSDNNVSMRARLAAHLQASGTMRWQFLNGSTYRCDLGLGAAQFIDVGSAAQIWNLSATLTTAQLTQARNAAAAAQHKPAPAAATPADVAAMKQALRAQFDLADANWQAWTP